MVNKIIKVPALKRNKKSKEIRCSLFSCLQNAVRQVIITLLVSIYESRTESHEQLFLHANWEQQTKESAVIDGTSCCVILECLVAPIACIT